MGKATGTASLQDGPTAFRPTYRLIQILRAVAAIMVVAHHATIMLFERAHLPSANWIAGSSGVDIFFVISGFVMTISSAPLRSVPHPARTFLARRLERIVPLYWLVTTGKVVVVLLAPALVLNGLGSLWHVVSSYLFLPSFSAEGRIEPVVVVGWTLNFEMAFYVLFAVALAYRWKPVWLVVPILAVLPLVPPLVPRPLVAPGFVYTSSVVWEFAYGVLLAQAIHRVRRLPAWLAYVLLPPALLLLTTWNWPGGSPWRGAGWGLPALALVLSALILEARWGAKSPVWALELGDASYSIYLIHTLTLPALGLLAVRWHYKGTHELAVALTVTILASVGLGEVVYRLVESPMTRWFKGRRRTAIPANV